MLHLLEVHECTGHVELVAKLALGTSDALTYASSGYEHELWGQGGRLHDAREWDCSSGLNKQSK